MVYFIYEAKRDKEDINLFEGLFTACLIGLLWPFVLTIYTCIKIQESYDWEKLYIIKFSKEKDKKEGDDNKVVCKEK